MGEKFKKEKTTPFMLRLARMNVFPPGGFAYVQPETGMRFDGNTMFQAQARQIATHRRANNLPRASVEEAEEDLMATVCGRYPGVCIDTVNRAASALAARSAPRRKCGSCGGRKR